MFGRERRTILQSLGENGNGWVTAALWFNESTTLGSPRFLIEIRMSKENVDDHDHLLQHHIDATPCPIRAS